MSEKLREWVFAMAQARSFSIIGDSNVSRNATAVNFRACPPLAGAQLLSCGRLAVLPQTLTQVTSDVCILSCITNFITKTKSAANSSVSVRVEPIIMDIKRYIAAASVAAPDRVFLICPPMFRTLPLWYRDSLPEVLTKFSQCLSSGFPPNVQLMPSFSTPQFEDDGVHLTPYSGLEFVLHLFDSAARVIDQAQLPLEDQAVVSQESTRHLEDRVVALEQDHRRLNKAFESKSAADAEMADFHENQRNEDCFVVTGLQRIIGDMSPRDWQDQAKKLVSEALRKFMDRDVPIVVVHNGTGPGRDAVVRYIVRTPAPEISKAVRDKFGFFFEGGKNTLPPELKGVSIRNRLTKATHVRLSILRLMGERYLSANKGAKVKVIGYQARPLLKLAPPSGASDRRIKTFNFIEAIRYLPTNFTSSELSDLLKKIDTKFHGNLRSLFVVINDDMLKPRGHGKGRGQGQVPPVVQVPAQVQALVPAQVPAPTEDPSHSAASDDSGSEEEEDDEEEQVPIAPQPPVLSTPSLRGARGSKRGPPSPGRTKSKSQRK